MNEAPTPLYSRVVHEQRHHDVADPACELCAAILRHPAGRGIAEVREGLQHDQAAADAAVRAQDDWWFLQRKEWLFTGLALIFAAVALALTVATSVPFNGVHILAILLGIAAAGCAIAAWHVHDRRVRGGDEQ